MQVDHVRLRQFFEHEQCPGVVALIDFLTSPEGRGVTYMGSATLRLATREGFYVGSETGTMTALDWLAHLSEVFSRVSPDCRATFDEVCGEMAAAATGEVIDTPEQRAKFA